MAAKASASQTEDELLRGRLSAFSCWEVLQWMAPRVGEGTLHVTRAEDGGRVSAWVTVRDGVVLEMGLASDEDDAPAGHGADGAHLPAGRKDREPALDDEADARRLGGKLLRMRAIDLAQLRFALHLQAMAGAQGEERIALGHLLERCGYASAREVTGALRELARERLATMFGWKEGSFFVSPALPAKRGLPVGERIEPLLLELMQAIDQDAIDQDAT